MPEFYTVKQIDNSRLVRVLPKGRLRDSLRRTVWGLTLGACAIFYAWQHFQCIQLRCDLQDLQTTREQAEQLNQQLRIVLAELRSPMRIDGIARQQLGLTVPLPSRVTPAMGAGTDAVLAQMRTVSAPNRQ
jgi:cell division protein FtsL